MGSPWNNNVFRDRAVSVKHRKHSYRTLALFIFLLSAVSFMVSESEVDPDLWGHILFGEETIRQRAIQKEDIYSYTSAGTSWINHEWLAEVILAGVYHSADSAGLVILKLLVVLLTAVLLIAVIRMQTDSSFIPCYLLLHSGYLIARDSFIRPQLFTCLLFTLSLLVICLYEKNSRWSLLSLPLIMLFWVNLHGGFLAGLGIFTAYVLGRLVEIKPGETVRSKRSLHCTLLLPLVLIWGATLLNPHIFGLWQFLFHSLIRPRTFVSDWRPVGLHLEHIGFLALFTISVLTVVISNHRRRPSHISMFIISAFFAFNHVRHIPLFAIVAAFVLPPHIADVQARIAGHVPSLKKTTYPLKRILPHIAIAVSLFLLYSGYFHPTARPFSIVIPQGRYPLYPVQIMEHFEIKGNIAVNQFGIGEYLLFKLFPESRISFDGRLRTVYSPEKEREYVNFMFGQKGWKETLEGYPTEIAVIQKSFPTYDLMIKEPQWIPIHDGPFFSLFVKDTQKFSMLIRKFRTGILDLPPPRISRRFPG
jgi:hypothetical protein